MHVLAEAGVTGWIHLVLIAGGLVWALVCAVLLAMRWKVPPVVATAPLLAHALTVLLGVSLSTGDLGSPADPAQRASLWAAAIAGVLSNGMLAPAVIPAAAILALGGLAAGVRGPRSWGAPIAAFFAAGAATLLPLVGLAFHAELLPAGVRFALYAACVLPVVAALTGAHARTNVREGGMVTAVAFASVVAALEVATISAEWSDSFRAMASVGAAEKNEIMRLVIEETAPLTALAWGTLALATVPAAMALGRPSIDLTDEEVLSASVNPSPMRWLGTAFALAVPICWAAALAATDVSGMLEAISKG